MFFDPIGVVRDRAGGRRAIPRRRWVRLPLVCVLLAAALLEPLVRLARFLAARADAPDVPAWAPGAAAGAVVAAAALVVYALRGLPHVALGGATAALGSWAATRPGAGHELAVLVSNAGHTLSPDSAARLVLTGAVTAAGAWLAFFGWWAIGQVLGWGGRFGYPELTWADPLLGNTCRPNIPPHQIVGYVVYRDWNLFEEVVAADLVGRFAFPVRMALVPKGTVIEPEGELPDGGWEQLAHGRVSVLCLLPHAGFRCVGARPKGPAMSLVEASLDGFRCTAERANAPGRDVNLYTESRLRDRTRDGAERIVLTERPEKEPAFRLHVSAPTRDEMNRSARGTPAVLRVSCRAEEVILVFARRGAYRITPLAPHALEALPPALMELVRPAGERAQLFIADALGTDAFDVVLNVLRDFFRRSPRWDVRAGSSAPPEYLPLLRRWTGIVLTPAGKLALAYLKWATDPTKKLDQDLAFDPYSGAVMKADGSARLLDLGGELAVTADGNTVLLPTPAEPLGAFFRCLGHLSRVKALGA